jgi:hypothetical protein
LRHPVWERVGKVPGCGLELVPFVDLDTGETGAHLEVAGDWFERSGLVEAPDSMPAIVGAIMAAGRVRLLEAIEAAGAEHVVYVDTDSLLVDSDGDRAIRNRRTELPFRGLVIKGQYQRAVIRGPRSLTLDDELRAAGVPRRSFKREDGRFEAQMWEGLERSLRRGSSSTVRVTRRIVKPSGRDSRRLHLPDGSTAPFQVGERAGS